MSTLATPAKKGLNFDLLQKLGKVLMTVIAVMPAAGIMLSLGKLFQMMDLGLMITIGSTMENIGWAILHGFAIQFFRLQRIYLIERFWRYAEGFAT